MPAIRINRYLVRGWDLAQAGVALLTVRIDDQRTGDVDRFPCAARFAPFDRSMGSVRPFDHRDRGDTLERGHCRSVDGAARIGRLHSRISCGSAHVIAQAPTKEALSSGASTSPLAVQGKGFMLAILQTLRGRVILVFLGEGISPRRASYVMTRHCQGER